MPTAVTRDPAQVTRNLLTELLGRAAPNHFAVRLWDGSVWSPSSNVEDPAFTIVLKHPGALRDMFRPATELNLAKRYIDDDYDVEGDMEVFMRVGEWLLGQQRGFRDKLRLGQQLLKLPNHGNGRPAANSDGRAKLSGSQHSFERDSAAVTHHYDVSNEFYSLWLDRNMVYSCALFSSPDEELDTAQERKLDFLCRKLRLQPGERLLDIGCGWGGLIRHAVTNYGCEALGITLSQRQADLANARISAGGLEDRCRVRVVDYRALDASEAFDKIVSVGMIEHVGRERLHEYFCGVHRLLKPGGVFLNHGIGDLAGRTPRRKPGFVRTFVFPDSDLPMINQVFKAAEDSGFEPRDLENLREHYAITLRHWVKRLEANHDGALEEVDEATYRVWRLYMGGCAYWFAKGKIGIFQTLFVKCSQGRSGLPLLRDDWYSAAPIQR